MLKILLPLLISATVVSFLGLELLQLWDRVSPFAVGSVKRGFNSCTDHAETAENSADFMKLRFCW
jgi:hypothetical protein